MQFVKGKTQWSSTSTHFSQLFALWLLTHSHTWGGRERNVSPRGSENSELMSGFEKKVGTQRVTLLFGCITSLWSHQSISFSTHLHVYGCCLSHSLSPIRNTDCEDHGVHRTVDSHSHRLVASCTHWSDIPFHSAWLVVCVPSLSFFRPVKTDVSVLQGCTTIFSLLVVRRIRRRRRRGKRKEVNALSNKRFSVSGGHLGGNGV